ncbi:MAG: protein kinase [Phycisphaeraceae bacterium]|nr:MAG: protein kinase [Phycisphaeraceae bacterium]
MREDDPVARGGTPGGQGERPTADVPVGARAGGVEAAPGPMRVAGYTIRRLIGSGGMGVVYEAVQDRPRRSVAVKVMSPKPGGHDAASVRRFLDEAQFLASLNHPGICQVFEAGTWEDGGGTGGASPYLVTEYIEGAQHLAAYAKGRPLRERVGLVSWVARAVHHGHTRGVVHRDLKPENILVGSDGRARVIDFGIAKALGADAVRSPNTVAGQVLGTLPYMSPEQLSGDRGAVGPGADVYALGVILYELVTGRMPHDLTEADLTRARTVVMTHRPPDPSALAPEADHRLGSVILKAIASSPRARFSTAEAFAEELDRWLGGRAVLTRRGSWLRERVEDLRLWSSRRPALAAAGVIGASVLAGQMVAAPGLEAVPRVSDAVYRVASGPAFDPSAAVAGGAGVRLLALDDGVDLAGLGSRFGWPELLEAGYVGQGLRPLWGRALKELSALGPRAVALDVAFPVASSNPEHDAAFVEGLTALRGAGVGFTSAVVEWPRPGEAPRRTPAIPAGTAMGGVTFGQPVEADWWSVDLAVLTGSDPVASLSLSAVSAGLRPGALVELRYHGAFQELEVRLVERSAEGVPPRLLEAPRRYRVSPVAVTEGYAPADLRVGDTALQVMLTDRMVRSVSGRALSLGAFLLDPGSFAEEVRGRVVVLADCRTTSSDYVTDASGARVYSPQVHAAAIGALMSGTSIMLPNTAQRWATCGVSAAAPVAPYVIPGVFPGLRGGRRRVVVVSAMMGAVVPVVMTGVVLWSASLLLNPLVLIAAGLVSAGLALVLLSRSSAWERA